MKPSWREGPRCGTLEAFLKQESALRLAKSVCAVAIVFTACNDQPPPQRRFVKERDTLVLYGDRLSLLPVKVVDAQGSQSREFKATIRQSAQSVLTTNGTWVSCRREGTAIVNLVADAVLDSIPVFCRDARTVRSFGWVDMDLHDPPRSLGTIAIMPSGDTEAVWPIRTRISDTNVVMVRNNEVFPRAVGHANLTIDYGGVPVATMFVIRETITSGTLTLNAGESRHWKLVPGRYDITVKVKKSIDLASLRMETEGANCARDSRDEDKIHCVFEESGTVSMTNTSTPPRARAASAVVTILKTP